MLARRYNRKGITNVRYQAWCCHFHSSLSSLDVLITFVLFIDTDSVSFKKNLKDESLLLIEQHVFKSKQIVAFSFKNYAKSLPNPHFGQSQWNIMEQQLGSMLLPPNKPESPGTSSPGMVQASQCHCKNQQHDDGCLYAWYMLVSDEFPKSLQITGV